MPFAWSAWLPLPTLVVCWGWAHSTSGDGSCWGLKAASASGRTTQSVCACVCPSLADDTDWGSLRAGEAFTSPLMVTTEDLPGGPHQQADVHVLIRKGHSYNKSVHSYRVYLFCYVYLSRFVLYCNLPLVISNWMPLWKHGILYLISHNR